MAGSGPQRGRPTLPRIAPVIAWDQPPGAATAQAIPAGGKPRTSPGLDGGLHTEYSGQLIPAQWRAKMSECTVYVEKSDGSGRIDLTRTADQETAADLVAALVRAIAGQSLHVGVDIRDSGNEPPVDESARHAPEEARAAQKGTPRR